MAGFGKILAVLFVAALLPQGVLAAASSQGLGATLGISGLQYLPNPAVPGQYLDVYFNVQNSKAQNDAVTCELRPEYPFSVDANEKVVREIGFLGTGQNFVLKFKVRVDAN